MGAVPSVLRMSKRDEEEAESVDSMLMELDDDDGDESDATTTTDYDPGHALPDRSAATDWLA